MPHITTNKGLNIPVEGKPEITKEGVLTSSSVSLSLGSFKNTRFKLLKKVDEVVKRGEAIAVDKDLQERSFVSPAGGIIKAVHRGLKRRILNIEIAVDRNEETLTHKTPGSKNTPKEDIINFWLSSGGFSHIHSRPFNLLANPHHSPKAIFIKACDFAPFTPPESFLLNTYKEDFFSGVHALSKLAPVYIVSSEKDIKLFEIIQNTASIITVPELYPCSSLSFAIQKTSPIKTLKDIIWTLSSYDTVVLGSLIEKGLYPEKKPLSIGGPAINKKSRLITWARTGISLNAVINQLNLSSSLRWVSGTLLTGTQVSVQEGFLGFFDYSFNAIEEAKERSLLHFFRPGLNRYTATKGYLSSIFPFSKKYKFNSNQHGETRAFVDGTVYQKFSPLKIPLMELVKAVIAEDFDLALELGILEVVPEDFALPTFVCPSKIDMVNIMEKGLAHSAKEVLI